MTTKIQIQCDYCEKSLNIEYPDSVDEHYCQQCWQKRENELNIKEINETKK